MKTTVFIIAHIIILPLVALSAICGWVAFAAETAAEQLTIKLEP